MDQKFRTSVERIRRDIDTLAKYSSVQSEGCTRFTYTKEFAEARDYIRSEMEKAGLAVREDAVGTVIGRMEGSDPDAPVIMTGSHFDTVKTGGKFDGMAGVTAALETARVLSEEGFKPRCSIEFVALPEEEGARFGSGLFASRAMCGQLTKEEIDNAVDEDGITLRQAMKAYGLDPDRVQEARRTPGSIRAFIELHIEQGPILEKEGTDVGIVDSIVGLRCRNYHVHGRSDHAGNTPMNMRADSLLAAMRAVTEAADKAVEIGENTVCTCGNLSVRPGAFNIVANETFFQLDCRSRLLSNVDRVFKVLHHSLDKSVRENPGLSYDWEDKLSARQVEMDEAIRGIMAEEARDAGLSTRHMLSGAGHDAMVMGSIADAAMVFVPSRGGRSHVPEEWTDYEDLQKGVELVYRTIRRLAAE